MTMITLYFYQKNIPFFKIKLYIKIFVYYILLISKSGLMNDISNLKNITVLYVEDEKDLREVTSSILQSFTKNQYIAANGQEGYELFLKHNSDIDLIISDINMPILNGLEMIKKIKDINKNVPIIVTTAISKDRKSTRMNSSH